MAELNVEPKQNRPWWLWLLLGVIGILVLIFLVRGCDDDNEVDRNMDTDTNTATTAAIGTDRHTTEGAYKPLIRATKGRV